MDLDDAWQHWQDQEKEYEHIITVLDRQGDFDQTHSDPAFYVRFLTLEESPRHATSSPNDASTAVKMLILLDTAPNPS